MKPEHSVAFVFGCIVIASAPIVRADGTVTFEAATVAEDSDFTAGTRYARPEESIRITVVDPDRRRQWSPSMSFTGPETPAATREHPPAAPLPPITVQELADANSALDRDILSFLASGTLSSEIQAHFVVVNEAVHRPMRPGQNAQAFQNARRTGQALATQKLQLDSLLRSVDGSRQFSRPLQERFQTAVIAMCYRTIERSGEELQFGASHCVPRTWSIAIVDPAGPLSIAVGGIMPFYGTPRARYSQGPNGELQVTQNSSVVGTVQPALFLGGRYTLPSAYQFQFGLDVAMGLGDRVGNLWGVGAFFGACGITLGIGAAVDFGASSHRIGDRTGGDLSSIVAADPLPAFYIRLAVAADVWNSIKIATQATGATAPPSFSGH